MARGKVARALAGLAIFVFATGGQAQSAGGTAAEIAARERATNCSLLEALLQRRAEIAASTADTADRKGALAHIDRRIADVRRHLGGEVPTCPRPGGA